MSLYKLEVFFDYACPYCLKGHGNLLELLPQFSQIEAVWRPCEAHPRPERYGQHSDLLIQGMFFAAETAADLFAYHERAYDAIHRRRVDVESVDAVAKFFADILNAPELRAALQSERFQQKLQTANGYAYKRSGVWAVPAYRLNSRRLDSVEDVGVSKEQLRQFLADVVLAKLG